ncbi:MAG: SDR family oxidoreductase [Spirochaetes bacterium]|nr:MAG: SDR family oxidoreductase [Spirochaetota bacterium]
MKSKSDINGSDTLKGKTALVTGASRGLGREIALSLGRAGARVIVTDLLLEDEQRDPAELDAYSPLAGHFARNKVVKTRETAREICEMDTTAIARKLDVTNIAEIEAVAAEAERDFGGVDILVSNAALMDNFGDLEEQTIERWERDLRVNLTGAFNCTKAVWPMMKRKGWGRVIYISSIAGLMGAWRQPSYGATKAGLIGLAKSLAIEGGRLGITVNAICPGFIETEAVKLQAPEISERIKKGTPLHRFGRPDEIGKLAVFLASDASSFMTGAAIPVTGGLDLLKF